MFKQVPRVPDDFEVASRTIYLERRRLIAEYFIDMRSALMIDEQHLKSEIDDARLRMAASFYAEFDRRIVVKQPEIFQVGTTFMWPRTWWDAFKLRWFPKWAKDRWPAEYETRTIADIRRPAINIDEPVYKACYVNLPANSQDGIRLFEIQKPEHNREDADYIKAKKRYDDKLHSLHLPHGDEYGK
jgi:hypothetical protein